MKKITLEKLLFYDFMKKKVRNRRRWADWSNKFLWLSCFYYKKKKNKTKTKQKSKRKRKHKINTKLWFSICRHSFSPEMFYGVWRSSSLKFGKILHYFSYIWMKWTATRKTNRHDQSSATTSVLISS